MSPVQRRTAFALQPHVAQSFGGELNRIVMLLAYVGYELRPCRRKAVRS